MRPFEGELKEGGKFRCRSTRFGSRRNARIALRRVDWSATLAAGCSRDFRLGSPQEQQNSRPRDERSEADEGPRLPPVEPCEGNAVVDLWNLFPEQAVLSNGHFAEGNVTAGADGTISQQKHANRDEDDRVLPVPRFLNRLPPLGRVVVSREAVTNPAVGRAPLISVRLSAVLLSRVPDVARAWQSRMASHWTCVDRTPARRW